MPAARELPVAAECGARRRRRCSCRRAARAAHLISAALCGRGMGSFSSGRHANWPVA